MAGSDFIQYGTSLKRLRKHLNKMHSRIPTQTISQGAATSNDNGRASFAVHENEPFYIKLTDKTGSSPIKYAWQYQNHDRTTDTWSDGFVTGDTTANWAEELNNASLSTTDNKRYRARVNPQSGRVIFESGGGGGGGANTTTNPIIMILGTYDEYKNCPGAPAAPPSCWPAYAWAAYDVCGYQYIKKFDARDYGQWALGLNGGSASAYRRFYSAFYGDSSISCQGVRFLEYCSQGTLSCTGCPSFVDSSFKCVKITFTTPARPCPVDSTNIGCGYNCISAFSGMDSASAWGQTFTTTLCKGINCSYLGSVGPFTITLNYEEIQRGYPTCDWGPSTFDPCDPCFGFGRWWLCIEGPGNSSSACSGCHFTGYYSNDQMKSIKTSCANLAPGSIKSCNACTNGTSSFKLIVEDSVRLTCCSSAENAAC